MTNKILSLEQARETATDFELYDDGSYKYKDSDCLMRLIIDGVDVLKGKNVVYLGLYENNSYIYRNSNGYIHLIIDGVDVFKGKKRREMLFKRQWFL